MNKRKAKKLRIGFYQETGYGLAWKTNPPQETLWEPFIDTIEAHKLFFTGSFHPTHGQGILSNSNYKKVEETQLENLIEALKTLPITNIQTYGPFDLNRPPKDLDHWLDTQNQSQLDKNKNA